MRRKSERTKEKEKSSPDKKSEKAPRRSRRHSRRSVRSVSASPGREESGAEENESSTMRSSQEDTEEDQTTCVEETSSQVGAVITADTVSVLEGEEDKQAVCTRSRKAKKPCVESVSSEEVQTSSTMKADVSSDSEWKEDKTFWEEGDSKLTTDDSKHKDKGSRSPVWKVKSSDGGGGEIQKLKLCIVRPIEPSDSNIKKKRRLSRNTATQMKEKSDIDDNDSNKESQGEEEEDEAGEEDKLSSEEKNIISKCQSDKEEKEGEERKEEEEMKEADQEEDRKEADQKEDRKEADQKEDREEADQKEDRKEADQKEDRREADQEEDRREADQEDRREADQEDRREADQEDRREADQEDRKEADQEEEKEKRQDKEEKEKETCVEETSCDTHSPETDVKKDTGSDIKSEIEDVKDNSPCQDDSDLPIKCERSEDEIDSIKDSTEECANKDMNESSMTEEESSTVVNTVSKSESLECEVVETKMGNTVSENECESNQVDSEVAVEDGAHQGDDVKNKSSESPVEVSSNSPNEEKEDSPQNTPEVICEPPTENEETENSKENLLPSHIESLPKDSSENTKATSEDKLELHVRSGSSEDEKEPESSHSSPRFKRRSVCRINRKESSPSEIQSLTLNNASSGKHSRHSERRNLSPRRKEKISLRRSFSGLNEERGQTKSNEQLTQSENDTTDNVNEDMKVADKENDSGKHSEDNENIKPQGHLPRKRRWGQSNSSRPSKKPVLSISTDSLKTLIPGAKLVPITEVQLVQDEDVKKEKEVWDYEKDSEHEKPKPEVNETVQLEKKATPILSDAPRISVALTDDHESKVITRKISIVSDDARTLQKSPSPPRHRATNVLYITNLVRPFTVNQLRELLARTGKIVEGGFWIDKIKSKCYVEYETETEAKETRHALHGVRWPVSNPKTLCVDFGRKEDMEMAQAVAESDLIPRKTEPLKVERSLDGWGVEQVREKEHEKETREHEREKEREYDRDRVRGKERTHHLPLELAEHHKKITVREWDLGKLGQMSPERDCHYDEKNKEKEKKVRKEKPRHSRSISPHDNPVRKVKKKEEDAPAKLLDDLFRKTKTTPCIYWLPLTAEQIVVKEEMRRKHMAEHERRMAEMRKAERERERVRAQQRQHRRVNEREKRRRRSGSASPKK